MEPGESTGQSYFRGNWVALPDNNALELQVDNYGPDLRKGLEAMHALQTSSNPLGVMVNPETFLAAWQVGATLTELHERSYTGEFAEGAASLPIGPSANRGQLRAISGTDAHFWSQSNHTIPQSIVERMMVSPAF